MNRSVSLPARSFQSWLPGLLVAASLTALAHASVIVTYAENHDPSGNGGGVNSGVALSMSATDLINAGQTSLASVSSSGFTSYTGPHGSGTSSTAALNDGSNGGWNLNASGTAVTTQATPWSITYVLNTAASPSGYDLTGIDVMSLWTNDFVNQNYTVEITTVSNPAFATLTGPVIALTSTAAGTNIGSSLESSVRDTTGVLATDVTAIRFTFSTEPGPGGASTLAAYREADVFGMPSVPEPAAWALTLLAAGACALRRRRA